MPKGSVIVPNFNHAKYLKQGLDNVLHQTHQIFKVWISVKNERYD